MIRLNASCVINSLGDNIQYNVIHTTQQQNRYGIIAFYKATSHKVNHDATTNYHKKQINIYSQRKYYSTSTLFSLWIFLKTIYKRYGKFVKFYNVLHQNVLGEPMLFFSFPMAVVLLITRFYLHNGVLDQVISHSSTYIASVNIIQVRALFFLFDQSHLSTFCIIIPRR